MRGDKLMMYALSATNHQQPTDDNTCQLMNTVKQQRITYIAISQPEFHLNVFSGFYKCVIMHIAAFACDRTVLTKHLMCGNVILK